ncbi:MAG: LapA family protein [Pseudomonadota bacterium]
MIRILIIAAVFLAFALGIAICLFNAQPVVFNYIAGSIQVPLIVLMVAEFFLVAAVTALLCWARIFGLKGEIRRLRRQLKDAQAELQSLRNLPLKDQ